MIAHYVRSQPSLHMAFEPLYKQLSQTECRAFSFYNEVCSCTVFTCTDAGNLPLLFWQIFCYFCLTNSHHLALLCMRLTSFGSLQTASHIIWLLLRHSSILVVNSVACPLSHHTGTWEPCKIRFLTTSPIKKWQQGIAFFWFCYQVLLFKDHMRLHPESRPLQTLS